MGKFCCDTVHVFQSVLVGWEKCGSSGFICVVWEDGCCKYRFRKNVDALVCLLDPGVF